jgi:hypothetical protein
MKNNRSRCYQIADRLCYKIALVSLSDLPDSPCLMHALDEMQELIEYEGEPSLSSLQDIALEAVVEILEGEGFPAENLNLQRI